MSVFLSMSLSVLIWSLYPLAAAIGLREMGNAQMMPMMVIVYFFAGFGALILSALYLSQRRLLSQAIQIQKQLTLYPYILIMISGVAGVLAHCFFILALTLANKGGVSLLLESWPIIAVVATPFLMKKTWKEVSFKEFLISLVALGGVCIVILSDQEINWGRNSSGLLEDKMSLSTLGGYILAFAGGYMIAVIAVTQAAYAEYFQEIKDDFGTTLIAQCLGRMISLFLILIIFAFLPYKIDLNTVHWGATAFIGIGVFIFGGALYNLSILRSESPTIHIMYYFVPLLAVIWLYFSGETKLNWGIAIGGLIIIACNIYLVLASKRARYSEPLL